MTTSESARRTVSALLGALWVALASAAGTPARAAEAPAATARPLVVFAAASLTEALDELDGAFTAKTHIPVKTSYAASSVLAKQIEAGAPADVFFSADPEWMDYLQQRQLLVIRWIVGHDPELPSMMDQRLATDIFNDRGIAAGILDGQVNARLRSVRFHHHRLNRR